VLIDHLEKLKPFQIIATTGKLHEAARRLRMSQPALSRIIQKLEQALGVSLFIRSRQGMALTPEGESLLKYTHRLLKETDDLEKRLQDVGSEIAGHLKIGTYETLTEYLWPEALSLLKQRYPSLTVTISTNASNSHQKQLESGDLDILVNAEPRVSGEFISWKIYSDRFALYSKDRIFPIKPGKIIDIPLIYVPSAVAQDQQTTLDCMEQAGYFFRSKIELDSFSAVRAFCKKGLGVGVLPVRLAESARDTTLKKVILPGIPSKGFGDHDICVTVMKAKEKDPRVRALLALLKELFR
jgi:DNA-binding transcriptional LysR family regulator